jgi:hypothetical protein
MLQVSACRPDRNLPSGVCLEEFNNRLAGPESEREFELVEALALDGPNDLRLLLRSQPVIDRLA